MGHDGKTIISISLRRYMLYLTRFASFMTSWKGSFTRVTALKGIDLLKKRMFETPRATAILEGINFTEEPRFPTPKAHFYYLQTLAYRTRIAIHTLRR